MNAGRLAGRMIARNVIARRNYGGGNLRQSTMNDLPTPQGDFFALHSKRESRYNAILGLGLVMFSSTLYLTYQSDIIHFNYSPPDTYE